MARAMNPVPPSIYYSFSIVDGDLRDGLGILPWQAHNPNYDPGPLPPPKNTDKADQDQPGSAPDTETEPGDGV